MTDDSSDISVSSLLDSICSNESNENVDLEPDEYEPNETKPKHQTCLLDSRERKTSFLLEEAGDALVEETLEVTVQSDDEEENDEISDDLEEETGTGSYENDINTVIEIASTKLSSSSSNSRDLSEISEIDQTFEKGESTIKQYTERMTKLVNEMELRPAAEDSVIDITDVISDPDDSYNNCDSLLILDIDVPEIDTMDSRIHLETEEFDTEVLVITESLPCRAICRSKQLNSSSRFLSVLVRDSQTLLTVSRDKVAQDSSPSYPVPVGSRVLAKCKGSWIVGVTAEPSKLANRHRYLVFLSNGQSVYVKNEDMRTVMDISEADLDSDGFTKQDQSFIKKYLATYKLNGYPETPFKKLKEGDIFKLNAVDKWWIANVVEIDSSIMKVSYSNGSQEEWIFRGSHRIGGNTESSQSTISTRCDDSDILRKKFKGPYAKKSTTRKTPPVSTDSVDTDVALHAADGSIVQVLFQPVSGLPFVPHDCSPSCVSRPEHRFSSAKISGQILLIPLQWGWSRQVSKHSSNGFTKVCYTAPCGRRLRTMEEVHRYLLITKLDMEVDMFTFEFWLKVGDEYQVKPNFIKVKDLSYGVENVPIPVVNGIDNSFNEHIDYSTRRLPQTNVNISSDQGFLICCDCEDDCRDKKRCACWQLTIQSTRGEIGGQVRSKAGYEYRRLQEPVLTGIYECNSKCKCSKTCLNRVVQNPLRLSFQVFKTENRGWGLRSVHDIPKGTFLCTYVGNLYNEEEGNREGLNFGDEYFADLDMIEVVESPKKIVDEDSDEGINMDDHDDNDSNDKPFKPTTPNAVPVVPKRKSKRRGKSKNTCTIEKSKFTSVRKLFGKEEKSFIMDAKKVGNIGRYLNHSCFPNVMVQNVFVDTHDLRFPWIAFFTTTFVRAGRELCWDYRYDVGSVTGKVIHCACGSEYCRGRLL